MATLMTALAAPFRSDTLTDGEPVYGSYAPAGGVRTVWLCTGCVPLAAGQMTVTVMRRYCGLVALPSSQASAVPFCDTQSALRVMVYTVESTVSVVTVWPAVSDVNGVLRIVSMSRLARLAATLRERLLRVRRKALDIERAVAASTSVRTIMATISSTRFEPSSPRRRAAMARIKR